MVPTIGFIAKGGDAIRFPIFRRQERAVNAVVDGLVDCSRPDVTKRGGFKTFEAFES
jgi:hypothetical protein